MGSVNVWVPDELLAEVEAAYPGVDVSAVLQEALRASLDCKHDELVCARCAAPVRRVEIAERVLTRFYADVQASVGDAMRKGRTLDAIARRVKRLGIAYQIRIASEHPLPGTTYAERRSAKVKDLPPPRRPPAAQPSLTVVEGHEDAG